jgi:hypothetical protein
MLTPKLRLTLLIPAVLLALLAAGGCGSKEDSSAPPPQQQPSPQKVRVEFRPPESGERLRRHIYAPDGVTEVELQIEYADGRMEFRYFRADGSLKESKETYPGGRVVKRHALFAADGTTVVAEEKYRLDGSLETEFKLLPDGTKETVAYRSDGKRRLSFEVQRPDSSSVKTYYRKDGTTTWAVFKTSASAQRQVDCYGDTGVLEHSRLYRADGMDVVVYRPDGTASHRQSWRLRYGGWYYRSYVLERLTEYAPDGTTPVRELKMSYDGVTVTEAHLFNPDGSKASIRYFRGDGTLEKEEFLDKDGKVKKTETHKADEGIRESVEQGRLKEPAFDDPSDPYRRRDD